MPRRVRRRFSAASLLAPLLLAGVAAYFVWQADRGTFGAAARVKLQAERAAREAALADLVGERERWERKVLSLRSTALDADLLDERLRAKLNMARPDELVIFHRDGQNDARPASAPR